MTRIQDRQAQAMQYLQLLQSGVPSAEAFKQAYPNGIPTQQQQLEQQSKDRQNSALVGTGGTIGGLLAAKYGMDAINAGLATDAAVPTFTALPGAAAGTGAASGGSAVLATGTTPAATGAGAGATSAAGTGSALTSTSTAGTIGGALLGAKGLYDIGKGWQNGGKGMRSGLTEAMGGTGLALGGPIGGAIGAVGGNIVGYGLQGNGWKNDAALLALGPYALPLFAAKKLGLVTPHKTTRQTAQEHSQQLLKDAGDDQNAQNYVQGMRAQFNEAPKGNAFAGGKYKTFDEYQKAGLDPKDLSGVYGNIKTFGPSAWAALSQDQREAVTQGLIGANLYKSKKGEVEITDADQAQQIYNTILGQNQPQAQPAVGTKIYQTLNNKNKK